MDIHTPDTSFPVPNATEQIVAKPLDQLDIMSRYSVIYEIARIDSLLGQAFVSDYSLRLMQPRAR